MAVRVADTIRQQNDLTSFPVAYGDSIWVDKNKGVGDPNYISVQEMYEQGGSGGEGTTDYTVLENKPTINSVQLNGDLTADDLNLASADEVDILTDKVDRLNIAQKTVNESLGYFFATYGTDGDEANQTITVTAKTNLIPNLTNRKINGIEVDSDGWVTLLGGHSYRIEANAMTSGVGQGRIYIIDKTGKMYHKYGYWNGKVATPNDTPAIVYISPQEDIEVGFCVTLEAGNQLLSTFCSFEAQEIGRSMVIDPLEHVNETTGIEDTPVGHVIAYMGTDAPAHYLVADGSSYNIADYPYLAQWVIDNYETVNYFGGDGVTTFAVPDLRGEFLRGTGTNSHTNQGNGGEVGEHQDATEHLYHQGGSNTTSVLLWKDTSVGAWGGINKNTDSVVTKTSGLNYGQFSTSTVQGSGAAVYTSRPTNTSVLWCIKYEPTYFMELSQDAYISQFYVDYSEGEKIIGKDSTGRPVYMQTINGISSPTIKTEALLGNIPNILKILDIGGSWDSGTNKTPLTYEYSPNGNTIRIDDSGNIYSYHITSSYNNNNVNVNVIYTKTTDTPNSFTPQMIFDQYSTEQLIEVPVTDDEINECLKGV